MSVAFRRTIFKLLLISAAISIEVLSPFPVLCQQDAVNVRAAYLFNILKYVNWPQDQSEIKVTVLADDRTSSVLIQVVNGKKIGGRDIRVLKHSSNVDLDSADVLYVRQGFEVSFRPAVDRLLRRQNHPILTIGETEQFLSYGGMFSLLRSIDRIQLEANADAIEATSLKISSGLLNIATIRRFERSSK